LTDSRGIEPVVAGMLTGSYWALFTIGRFSAGLYTRRIKLQTLMYISILAAMLGVIMLWWNPVKIISLIGVGLVGLAIAPIFPGLMSGTSQRVQPKFAANAIGMQMSAAGIGSAAIPALIGITAKNYSLEVIPPCLFTLFTILLAVYAYTSVTGRQEQAETQQSPALDNA
jgi:fucose permease